MVVVIMGVVYSLNGLLEHRSTAGRSIRDASSEINRGPIAVEGSTPEQRRRAMREIGKRADGDAARRC